MSEDDCDEVSAKKEGPGNHHRTLPVPVLCCRHHPGPGHWTRLFLEKNSLNNEHEEFVKSLTPVEFLPIDIGERNFSE
jgi:hypothetical protein